jgi:hypothetical protein
MSVRPLASACLIVLLPVVSGCSGDSSPDGRAAQWVLRTGGFVDVAGDGEPLRVNSVKELPPAPLTVLKIGWLSYPGDHFPEITDDSLENLDGLTHLIWLDLSGTAVTDAGLQRVAQLTGLKELYLNHTAVTDAGLVHLEQLDQLHVLGLEGTQTTDAGRRKLREKLPQLKLGI